MVAHLGPSCANRIGAGPSSSPPRPRRCTARAAQPAVLLSAPAVSEKKAAEGPAAGCSAACHALPPLPVSCGPLSPLVAELEAALQREAAAQEEVARLTGQLDAAERAGASLAEELEAANMRQAQLVAELDAARLAGQAAAADRNSEAIR